MTLPLAKNAGIFSNLAGKLRGAMRGATPALAQEARAVSHAAPAATGSSTMAGRLRAVPPVSHAPEAFAPTVAHPSQGGRAPQPAAGAGWGAQQPAAGGWGGAHLDWGAPAAASAGATVPGKRFGAPPPARPAVSKPNPNQRGNPVDQILPGFMQHDKRLRDIQGKLQAREAAGKLSPQRERLQYNIDEARKDLHRQLDARAGSSMDTHVDPHFRQGREVVLKPGGLSFEDEKELTHRTMMPRKGTPEQRAQRMMPALSMNQYNRQVAMRGAEDPAMRAVAQTVNDARARNAMIPQAIMPKLSSLRGALAATKTAFLGGALKRFGDLAHADPVRALARAHAADQGLRGALYGGLIGGAGGALLSRPGDEEGMALRGALAGALGGGGYGAYAGHRDAKNYLATPEGLKALAGRLSALHAAGGPLSHAFTA